MLTFLVGGEYTYAPTFDPRTTSEFDDTYVVGNSVMKYTTQRTIYKLENLFNANSFEGKYQTDDFHCSNNS